MTRQIMLFVAKSNGTPEQAALEAQNRANLWFTANPGIKDITTHSTVTSSDDANSRFIVMIEVTYTPAAEPGPNRPPASSSSHRTY
jgi:hypothetical protein